MVSTSVKIVKWLLFVFNFVFFLTGCSLIGIGVWLNIERNDWEGISDYDYISVANLIISAGVIIIIVAFLGCCGAITENKIMLTFFFIFLLVIFILEMAAGIAAYVWRDELNKKLKDQLTNRIPDRYYIEEGVRTAMNSIQDVFNCCGVDGIRDWRYTKRSITTGPVNGRIDQSCCKKSGVVGYSIACISNNYDMTFEIEKSSPYYANGCYQSIQSFLKDNLLYVGICGIIFAIFKIIGMAFAMVLYCALRKEAQIA